MGIATWRRRGRWQVSSRLSCTHRPSPCRALPYFRPHRIRRKYTSPAANYVADGYSKHVSSADGNLRTIARRSKGRGVIRADWAGFKLIAASMKSRDSGELVETPTSIQTVSPASSRTPYFFYNSATSGSTGPRGEDFAHKLDTVRQIPKLAGLQPEVVAGVPKRADVKRSGCRVLSLHHLSSYLRNHPAGRASKLDSRNSPYSILRFAAVRPIKEVWRDATFSTMDVRVDHTPRFRRPLTIRPKEPHRRFAHVTSH